MKFLKILSVIIIISFLSESCEHKSVSSRRSIENNVTLNPIKTNQPLYLEGIDTDTLLFNLLTNYTPHGVSIKNDLLLARLKMYSPTEQLNSFKLKCSFYYIVEKHFYYLATNKIRSGLGLTNIPYWTDLSELGQYIVTYIYAPESFKKRNIGSAPTDWIFISDLMALVDTSDRSCIKGFEITHLANKNLLKKMKK